MNYVIIKKDLIFCNQIRIIEEIETYNCNSIEVTFIDGTRRLIYDVCLKEIKFSNSRMFYEENKG